MMVRMQRKVSQEAYLRELAATYGSLSQLERLARKTPDKRPLVEEWRFLLANPERAKEVLSIRRELVFHDFEKFLRIVTPQRLRLLEYLRAHPGVDSLNELAKKLGRDYRNVHSDAETLAASGVIDLEARSNRVVPRVVAESIEVSI